MLCLACAAGAADDVYVTEKPERTDETVLAAAKEMKPLDFTPAPDRWENLPITAKRLAEGGELNVVMLGDSIVNDTARSNWTAFVQPLYPKCKIHVTLVVRGSTGCWWYREDGRVDRYVLPYHPDLLIIGGISQRHDIDAIRDVIQQVRAKRPCDVLLLSPAFGFTDPNDPTQWRYQIPEMGETPYSPPFEFLEMSASNELPDAGTVLEYARGLGLGRVNLYVKDTWKDGQKVIHIRTEPGKAQAIADKLSEHYSAFGVHKEFTEMREPMDGQNIRARLRDLAAETHSGFLDMFAEWGKYMRSTGKPFDTFHRDQVHANLQGELIMGRILARYLSP